MSKLVWDQSGERFYENGVSKGVLFVADDSHPGQYLPGVAWNGLASVSESPSGAEPSPIYADNIKYLNILSVEEFEASIEAYTYPDAFAECDGSAEPVEGMFVSQQPRKTFALAYRTEIGNDVTPEKGYKLHIIYGALAAPTEKSYESINDSPEAMTFSWDLTTTPVEVTGYKPTAHVVIDSTKADPALLTALEDILYGTEGADSTLLTPNEIIAALTPAG